MRVTIVCLAVEYLVPDDQSGSTLINFPCPNGLFRTGDLGKVVGGGGGTASYEFSVAAGAAVGEDVEDIVRIGTES